MNNANFSIWLFAKKKKLYSTTSLETNCVMNKKYFNKYNEPY